MTFFFLLLLSLYVFACMSKVFFFILNSRLASLFRKETVRLALCLYIFFYCGAVALSTSFIPFGVFDGRC